MAKKEKKVADAADGGSELTPLATCAFNLKWEAYHEGGHTFKIKRNWINVESLEFEEVTSEQFKDWELIKKEGEEAPVEEEEPEPEKGGKKAKGGAKKAPVEELDDNPRIIAWTEDIGTEEAKLTMTEDYIKKLAAEGYMKVQLIEINPETNEEEEVDEVQIDLTCLLFPKVGKTYEWSFEHLKTPKINHLKLSLTTTDPIMTDFYRKKYNPLELNILSAKDIPEKEGNQFMPVFSVCRFVDGQEYKTSSLPQDEICKWMHHHCFLLGEADQVVLKELLETQTVKIELHDSEEEVKVVDPDQPKFPFGLAKISLKDILNPYSLQLRLRADVFPLKRDINYDNFNLDLNQTARKAEMDTLQKFCPYLNNGTYFILSAELARPIGIFDESAEIEKIKAQKKRDAFAAGEAEEEAPPAEEKQEEDGEGDAEEPVEEERVEDAEVEEITDIDGAIYERAMYLMPYKSGEVLKKVHSSIERINLDGIGERDSDNVRLLTTKQLNEEERANRTLDIIGGFEFIDSDFRIIVLEGLGGKGHSMDRFYKDNIRDKPNKKRLKLLYNPAIKFKNRLYHDFNVTIKKIKLRDTLTEIMSSPDIFLRSKVPAEIYDTLQKMAEMRKYDRLKYLKDYDLFPHADKLLQLERKYGDSISYQDLHGFVELTERQKQRQREEEERRIQEEEEAKRLAAMTETEKRKSIYSTKLKAPTDSFNPNYDQSIKDRPEKNHITKNVDAMNSLRGTKKLRERIEVPDGVEVFMYSGQKLNVYDFQKEKLRKKLSEDPKNFYTWAEDHLSLAFPIVNEHEIKSKEKLANTSRWLTKDGFENVLRRTVPYNEHGKKPPQCKLDELQFPYLEEQKLKKAGESKKVPLEATKHGSDFNLNIKAERNCEGQELFSKPDFFKTVHLGGDDVIKEREEAKKKEHEEWKKKVVVKSAVFKVNTYNQTINKPAQVDKHQGILKGKPMRAGLRLNNSQLKNAGKRAIHATKFVDDLPSTVFMGDEYLDNRDPFKDNKKHDPSQSIVKRDFDIRSKGPLLAYDPKSTKVFIDPLKDKDRKGWRWGKQEAA